MAEGDDNTDSNCSPTLYHQYLSLLSTMKGLNLSGLWQRGHSDNNFGSSQASAGSSRQGDWSGVRPEPRLMAPITSRISSEAGKRSPHQRHMAVTVSSQRPLVLFPLNHRWSGELGSLTHSHIRTAVATGGCMAKPWHVKNRTLPAAVPHATSPFAFIAKVLIIEFA